MKNQNGQTILEVLIAVFIMVIGIVSLIALAIASNVMARQTTHDLIAINLARESLDAVRNQRDSNWLEIEAGLKTADQWDYNLYSGTDYTAVWNLNRTTGVFTPNFTPNSINRDQARVLLLNNVYFQNATGTAVAPDVGATTSLYRRFVSMYPICLSGSTERVIGSSTCALTYPGSEKIGVDVRVQIQWVESGRTKTTNLQEKMYAWKY